SSSDSPTLARPQNPIPTNDARLATSRVCLAIVGHPKSWPVAKFDRLRRAVACLTSVRPCAAMFLPHFHWCIAVFLSSSILLEDSMSTNGDRFAMSSVCLDKAYGEACPLVEVHHHRPRTAADPTFISSSLPLRRLAGEVRGWSGIGDTAAHTKDLRR
ncbi:unnamed protein product, partial [Ectocarpus sp. 8 AP-2014]